MNRYNTTLSDVLSPKFANLVWQHATRHTSAEQEQLVAVVQMHYDSRQCFYSA